MAPQETQLCNVPHPNGGSLRIVFQWDDVSLKLTGYTLQNTSPEWGFFQCWKVQDPTTKWPSDGSEFVESGADRAVSIPAGMANRFNLTVAVKNGIGRPADLQADYQLPHPPP